VIAFWLSLVAKPSGLRKRAVSPASPRVAETMHADLRARGQLRDATLVAVLAHAGLRPGEALSWAHVKDRVLLVERVVVQVPRQLARSARGDHAAGVEPQPRDAAPLYPRLILKPVRRLGQSRVSVLSRSEGSGGVSSMGARLFRCFRASQTMMCA
jgi:hypothetical protein